MGKYNIMHKVNVDLKVLVKVLYVTLEKFNFFGRLGLERYHVMSNVKLDLTVQIMKQESPT